MPINPQPSHTAGEYPDTIRHISNGDPANQTFMRNPSIDLEYRTDVLKDFTNSLESTVIGNFNTLDAFDKNHDHSGSNGEKVLNFGQIYTNSSQIEATFSLAVDGVFSIKKSGGSSDLLRLDDAATTNETKIIFPGSVDIFTHIAAPASDVATNPHNLALAARVAVLSSGCLIDGASNGPYTEITLDPGLPANDPLAAPELTGKEPTDGSVDPGILVGDLTTPGSPKDNVVMLIDTSTKLPVLSGVDPVYGLLEDIGVPGNPVWRLSFFAAGAVYNFTSDTTVYLYGQEAFDLSNVPVVDPRFPILAQQGFTIF
jgi:hypothetical protein